MDLPVKVECIFIFVKQCALSDIHYVLTKIYCPDNTEFAAQGGRGKAMLCIYVTLQFQVTVGLDNISALN